MKKLVAVFTVIMVLVLVGSASAIDQKGRIGIGAYGGYSFGFGDAFEKYEILDNSLEYKLGFCFGGKVKYGVTPNIALVGNIDYQSAKTEWETVLSELDEWGFEGSGSETSHSLNILAYAMYLLNPEAKTSPYFMAGGGFYIPSEEGADSKPGINGGVGVEHFFKENMALDAGARFHMIFTEGESTTYIQGFVGFIYYLGAK